MKTWLRQRRQGTRSRPIVLERTNGRTWTLLLWMLDLQKLCYNILQKKGMKVVTINVTKQTKHPPKPTSLFLLSGDMLCKATFFALSTRSTPPPLNSSPYQSFTVPYPHTHHQLLIFLGPPFSLICYWLIDLYIIS